MSDQPETATMRVEKLRGMIAGESIQISKSDMPRWRYPVRKVQERGDCHYSVERHGDGYIIWRQS
ncbi:hypothetical protein RFN29_15090 [Mesorhizobium sp. VK22B]|uniref:DUF2249 domain-containing protein n=1 Tax=Mesorhizobium captivum TaxID=3072319 RepID=A0ABU4Z115_9HYPH|nr:hypothetical protein [Mesorhizobium sp. VK22B]MDX8492902.1 hypothetical protein [Mesorhizobium sp. VK22B]